MGGQISISWVAKPRGEKCVGHVKKRRERDTDTYQSIGAGRLLNILCQHLGCSKKTTSLALNLHSI